MIRPHSIAWPGAVEFAELTAAGLLVAEFGGIVVVCGVEALG